MFIDKARIFVKAGNGGNGSVSFRREKYVPAGGPDGGDGGRGASIIFKVDTGLRTLMDFKYKKKYVGEPGADGSKKRQAGKNGEDLVLKVPPGTIIRDEATNLIIADLKHDGDEAVVAKGGRGGKGNQHFANAIRQAPSFAKSGTDGEERWVILELKMIADVGLLGFPNVGKSTFLSVVTKARPKIANYHFTTLTPNLGVVKTNFGDSFVLADIPGLIEGAAEGVGLGHDFLRHVERTKVLIHVVDISGIEGRDPIEDFDKINKELEQYSEKLLKKPQIVAANKIDLIGEDSEEYKDFKAYVEEQGYEVFPMSAPINQGVQEVLAAAANKLQQVLAEPQEEDDYELFDFEKDENDPDYRTVTVSYDGNSFVLHGKQLLKIFNSTNFTDFGSLRYLYKYIEKSGAIDQMKEMGIEDGDIIKIEDFEFEYYDEDYFED